jgi:uncharacterized protein YdhG (YjbR/CyaY superfamily)
MKKYQSWDEYFNDQAPRGKVMLEQMRKIFKETVPSASESWGYGVPAYELVPNAKNDKKIMIAGFKSHISFYPTPETIEAFKDELKAYKLSKGTIQFQHSQELPIELIKKMILHRYHDNAK